MELLKTHPKKKRWCGRKTGFDATSTPTTGMVPLTIMDTPAGTKMRKRKAPPTDADNKSKNCRNANPRTSAASAINNLMNKIGNN